MTVHSAAQGQKISYGTDDRIIKAAFSAVFAILMAVSANTFFYLPFTPVPVTLQVLTVVFSAIMLGGRWSLVSQAAYISMGIAGLPVFAGFASGPAVLLGPTGGYIIGFALAAYVTGSFSGGKASNKFFAKNSFFRAFIAGMSGLAVIYILGGIHLCGFLYSISGAGEINDILRSTWIMGIKPFIIMDAAKITAAIIILRPGITIDEDN